jgi:RNA recognition motif-containing protein
MSQVKVLYVRNITSDISENDVKDLFLPYGNIERVRKVRVRISTHFKLYKNFFYEIGLCICAF